MSKILLIFIYVLFFCSSTSTNNKSSLFFLNRKTPSEIVKPYLCKEKFSTKFIICSFPLNITNDEYLIIDYGQTLSGYLNISLIIDKPTEITIGFCESSFALDPLGDALSQHPFNSPNYYPTIKKITTPGLISIISDFSGAFRYSYITISSSYIEIQEIFVNTKLSLNIERNKPYPGNFRCNDELLTNIWYTGVYTQEISTGGTSTIIDSKYRQFIDGGKRDRALWSADTWVQLLVSLVSNYDIEGAKNTLESFANKQYSDGYIPHMIPVDGEEEKIALKLANELVFSEYQCWFIIDFWEYYHFTGDLSFLKKYENVIDKAINWLNKKKGPDGLLDVNYGIGGFFGDGSSWHTPDATTGKVTHLNSLIVLTIEQYKQIKEVLGVKIDSDWDIWKNQLIININKNLWNSEKKVYRNTNNGFLHPEVIVHDANIISILSKVANKTQTSSIYEYLEKNLYTKYGILTVDNEVKWPPSLYMFPFMSKYISPYYNFIELYTRLKDCDLICAQKIINIIKKCWGHMLSFVSKGGPTTFWEKISLDGNPEPYRQTKMPVSYTSLAHGWSSGPVWLLSRIFLGVQIIKSGYKEILIQPYFEINGIYWAEGTVPTPLGVIYIKWQIFNQNIKEWLFEIEIPDHIYATVKLPDESLVIIEKEGIYSWKTKSL